MASYWREDIPIHEPYQIPASQNYIYILFSLLFLSTSYTTHKTKGERERERCVDWGGWARVYNDSHGQVTNITGLSFSLFLGLWHVDVRPYFFLSFFPLSLHFIFIYSIHSVLLYDIVYDIFYLVVSPYLPNSGYDKNRSTMNLWCSLETEFI